MSPSNSILASAASFATARSFAWLSLRSCSCARSMSAMASSLSARLLSSSAKIFWLPRITSPKRNDHSAVSASSSRLIRSNVSFSISLIRAISACWRRFRSCMNFVWRAISAACNSTSFWRSSYVSPFCLIRSSCSFISSLASWRSPSSCSWSRAFAWRNLLNRSSSLNRNLSFDSKSSLETFNSVCASSSMSAILSLRSLFSRV